MRGDHDVNISYWKAWCSREVALEYSKGSSADSYKLLPDYLDRLLLANLGSISQIETHFQTGVGHRFKYMFLALGACIRGYEHMHKVVIVDETHLRGKYGGCLLTASAQDGNYQVFPLAVVVVDSENDKAWKWFFKMLLEFIPNQGDVVFVSDMHSSIYYAISKMANQQLHSPTNPHFFQSLRPGFETHLTIPLTFFSKHIVGKKKDNTFTLTSDVSAKTWEVQLDGMRVTRGWKDFTTAHDLRVGDILIFKHEGDMVFNVTPFGPSCVEIQYKDSPIIKEGVNTDDDDDNDNHPAIMGNGLSFDYCFAAKVTTSNVKHDKLCLTMGATGSTTLNKQCKEIILVNKDGNLWTVSVRFKKSGGM